MAKIKFSISFDIPDSKISEFIEEHGKMFSNVDYTVARETCSKILAIQMFNTTLASDTLTTKDFKFKLNE
jgi:hypothetical protein